MSEAALLENESIFCCNNLIRVLNLAAAPRKFIYVCSKS
jgi:hypothetical protein